MRSPLIFCSRRKPATTAGTAAKLDVVRAQVDLGQADNALLGNVRDIANARVLAQSAARAAPLPAPVAPADTLAVPPPLPDLTAIEQHALDARPELSGMRAQQAGARATTSLAREYWIPDLFFGASARLWRAGRIHSTNRNLIGSTA